MRSGASGMPKASRADPPPRRHVRISPSLLPPLMATCDTCGNDYDRAFTVTLYTGETLTFDSVECAAQRIAPTCAHCGVRVLGHGLEAGAAVYCCDHCAKKAGVTGLNDSV